MFIKGISYLIHIFALMSDFKSKSKYEREFGSAWLIEKKYRDLQVQININSSSFANESLSLKANTKLIILKIFLTD